MLMIDEFFYWMFHSLDGLGIFFGTIIFVIIICIEVYGKYLRWKEEKSSKSRESVDSLNPCDSAES